MSFLSNLRVEPSGRLLVFPSCKMCVLRSTLTMLNLQQIERSRDAEGHIAECDAE